MALMLKAVLGLMTSFFGFYYFRDVILRRKYFSDKPWPGLLVTGFIFRRFADNRWYLALLCTPQSGCSFLRVRKTINFNPHNIRQDSITK
jgi:hypothetical protein